jgi:hypothetical protein
VGAVDGEVVGAVAAGVAGNPRLTAPDAPPLASAAPAQQAEIPIASNSRLTGIKGYYPNRGQVRKKPRIGKAAVIMSAVALFIPPLAAIVANAGPANRQ